MNQRTHYLTGLLLAIAFFFNQQTVKAQAGISSSPAKLYYHNAAGTSGTGKILVENPMNKDLEIGVTMGDWTYDSLGENKLYDPGTVKSTCASWISIPDGTFFTLKAHERKEMKVVLKVPADADTSMPVHTAMLYLTQLNPGDAVSDNGAAIKVTVRMATKIYHAYTSAGQPDLEIADFKMLASHAGVKSPVLNIGLKNTGRLWLEGEVKMDLLNAATGKKVKLDAVKFYSLPGDYRIVNSPLPADLPDGHYTVTAVVKYEGADEMKLAELEIDVPKK